MPISSGATGRVDVGIDTSIAWTPDGLKSKPVSKNCDSYLKRYLESTQKTKQNGNSKSPGVCDLINIQNDRLLPNGEINGTREGTTQENEGSDCDTSGKQPSHESSKKSKTCTLL